MCYKSIFKVVGLTAVAVVLLVGCGSNPVDPSGNGGDDQHNNPVVPPDNNPVIPPDNNPIIPPDNNPGGGGYTGSDGSVTYGGKTYRTVKIGSQTWFAENLNYDIPNVTTDVCYGNSADSCAKYGRLYDWDAAMIACPTGWHLPTDDEWATLIDYAGGGVTAGKKLLSTTVGGTDDYGFSALLGGAGAGGTIFQLVNVSGNWWSATEEGGSRALWWLMVNGGGINRASNAKIANYSVRCVKN